MSTQVTAPVTRGAHRAERPPAARQTLSEGAKAERRLAYLLCAPAVVIMLAVTAYPIGYAVWLSLQRYDLRFRRTAPSPGSRTTSRC